MAKRRVIEARVSRGASAKLPAHEGPPPDPADTKAYANWLRVRHARFGREVGGPNDPRRFLWK
jgi:hypothetical protein